MVGEFLCKPSSHHIARVSQVQRVDKSIQDRERSMEVALHLMIATFMDLGESKKAVCND